MIRAALTLLAALSLLGCGSTAAPPVTVPPPPAPKPIAAPDPEGWRDARPNPGTAVPLDYPAVETAKLDTGLTLYVVSRPSGVTSLSLVARGGASRLPVGKSGLAAFTTRLMTEGTKHHGALALAEAVESMGTTLEESAGRDFVRLGMTVLRDDVKRGLTLLSEVAREPAFDAKEIERVRREWLDAIEAERQNPGRVASLVGLRLLLGTALGAPVNGSRKDVTALTRTDLVQYYKENFFPGNLALVVVGDVTLADVRPMAAELFGSLRGSGPKAKAATETPPASPGGKIHLVDRPGAVQSALFLAQPFPKRSEPGFESRELLNNLLGGFFTSRLNLNLREEHAFTYGVRSLDIATRDWGAFAVMTSVRTDVTVPALAEAMTEIKKAREPSLGRPISNGEVEMARVDLRQHLGATLSETDEVAQRVEELFVHALPDDYLRKYSALLDGITPAVVAQEGQRLDPSHSVVVIVGDRAALAPQLASQPLPVEAVPDAMTD